MLAIKLWQNKGREHMSQEKQLQQGKAVKEEKNVDRCPVLPYEHMDFYTNKSIAEADEGYQFQHKHALATCKRHDFCEINNGVHFVDLDNSLTLPFQCKQERIEQQEYAKMKSRQRSSVTLKDEGLRVLVTEQTLDHWMAQSFDLNINKLPQAWLPGKHNREVYEYLKSKYKDGVPCIPGAPYRPSGMAPTKGENNDSSLNPLSELKRYSIPQPPKANPSS